MKQIQFITHQNHRYSYVDSARMALEGGCRWIQLRWKDASTGQLIDAGREIAAMWGMLAIIVILSEAKNLFPCEPKAACGLCRARRRKTNEVQSRICLRILLYRFFVDLPISSE